MNAAIMILQYEHGVIRQVSDVLEAILAKNSLSRNRTQLQQIIDFLSSYMDRFHHRKEERFIFPEAEKIAGQLARDVERLKNDHQRAKELIHALDSNLSAAAAEEELPESFPDTGRRLVRHIADHIQYEEDHFFPGFENDVPADRMGIISRKFKEFLEAEFGADFHKRGEDFSFRIQEEILGPGFYESGGNRTAR